VDLDEKREELRNDLLYAANKMRIARKQKKFIQAAYWKGWIEKTEDFLLFLDSIRDLAER
jgi:hypothetical protein